MRSFAVSARRRRLLLLISRSFSTELVAKSCVTNDMAPGLRTAGGPPPGRPARLRGRGHLRGLHRGALVASAPHAARPLRRARCTSACCASSMRSVRPRHAPSAASRRSAPYAKVNGHGRRRGIVRLSAHNCSVASCSSAPAANAIPATATGTVAPSTRSVAATTSAGSACRAHRVPGVIIVGCSTSASNAAPAAASSATRARRMRSVASADRAMSCAPFASSSVTITGTMPASCAVAANRASTWAFAATARSLGAPGAMRKLARSSAKRAPSAANSTSRPRKPSSPSTTCSPGADASGTAGAFSAIPGTMPRSRAISTSRRPPAPRWRNASLSSRMPPA